MPALKLVMLGTGEFALPAFQALYETPHQVVGLYTQPERTGRGHHRLPPNPLKQWAIDRNTPVFQPENINTPESLAELRSLNADVFVVAAYGQILSPEFLSIPRLCSINIHASLLSKYRGASPIAYAIWKGEAEAGVSIIQVVPKLDAGPVIAMGATPIGPDETAGSLEVRLSQLAIPLVKQSLDEIAAGTARWTPQDDSQATRARKLTKQQGAIDWNLSPREIDCHIRAMQPWPNAFTFVHKADQSPLRVLVLAVRSSSERSQAAPGTILRADKNGLIVKTGEADALEIVRLQPDGKRAMPATDFLRGYALQPGDRVGPE